MKRDIIIDIVLLVAGVISVFVLMGIIFFFA